MRRNNLAYIIWALLVIGGIIGGSQFMTYLQAKFRTDFISWHAMLGAVLVYCLLGLLLGLDNIIREAGRPGSWSVRKGKLFGFGIPCLLLLLALMLPYWGVKIPLLLGFLGVTNYPFILYLISLVLGNIISTSICRQELRIWSRANRRY